MRAGQLRHRMTIEAPSQSSQNTFGEPVVVWETFATIWATLEPMSGGREYFDAKQLTSNQQYLIRTRYIPGVLPSMRVIYGGRMFEIVAPPVNVGSLGRELQLMGREVL